MGHIKADMSVGGNSKVENSMGNVLSLFGGAPQDRRDPLRELLNEAVAEAFEEITLPTERVPKMVTQEHFPDQSMYLLDQQLKDLEENLRRMKFYLSDLDDLLPS